MKHSGKKNWKSCLWILWVLIAVTLIGYVFMNTGAGSSSHSMKSGSSAASGSRHHRKNVTEALSPEAEGSRTVRHGMAGSSMKTTDQWGKRKEMGKQCLRLILMISIAVFIGAIMEIRKWLTFAERLLAPLVRFSHLPPLAASTMTTALFSNQAANTMLVGAWNEGKISRFDMRAAAMCNSYPAYVSHALRSMFPVIGAIGWPAAAYFGILFASDFAFVMMIMGISRFRHFRNMETQKTPDNSNLPEVSENIEKPVPGWRETVQISFRRTFRILWRVLLVTIPLYLLMTHLADKGFFRSLDKRLPESVSQWVSPEILAVALAKSAGTYSAAGVASGFQGTGHLSGGQILLALLLGNILTNPIRTLRRNLPTAMGIFPSGDGMFIVLIHQAARLCFAILWLVSLSILFPLGQTA